MRITSREKGLIIVLIIVAAIVFLMPGEDNISFESGSKISKTVTNILIAKYRYVRPFELKEKKVTDNSNFTLKRNIFQYGLLNANFNNSAQQKENKEQKIEDLEKKLEKEKTSEETLPVIDFKILGIIKAESGIKAIVVTKGPELFVFREGDEIFGKFILNKVDDKSVTIGFKGFEDEKTINLENKGGF